MFALYRSGRQADALRSFQEARSALVDELGHRAGARAAAARARDAPPGSVARPGRDRDSRAFAARRGRGRRGARRPARAGRAARAPPGAGADRRVPGLVGGRARAGRRASSERARSASPRTVRSPGRRASRPRARATRTVRLATEQDVDLLLLHGTRELLDDPATRAVLAAAPCDVGVLVGRDGTNTVRARSSCPSEERSTTGRRSRSGRGSRARSRCRSDWSDRARSSATPAACSRAPRSPRSARSASPQSRLLVAPGADALVRGRKRRCAGRRRADRAVAARGARRGPDGGRRGRRDLRCCWSAAGSAPEASPRTRA